MPKQSLSAKPMRTKRLSPEMRQRILENIAEESNALIKPRFIDKRSESQIDMVISAAFIGFAIGPIVSLALFPSAPRLLILISCLGILTLLAGALILAEIPIVYDHRVCRRCGYAYDEEAQPGRCPECGVDLQRCHSVGYWRSWRPKLRKYFFWTLFSWLVIALFGVAIWKWMGLI